MQLRNLLSRQLSFIFTFQHLSKKKHCTKNKQTKLEHHLHIIQAKKLLLKSTGRRVFVVKSPTENLM